MEHEETRYPGLSPREAASALARYGTNDLVQGVDHSPLRMFARSLNNPLVFVLIVAALLSAFLGEFISASIIIVMVLLSTVLDFLNTYRAQRAADELQERVKLTALVIRDGRQREIPFSLVVPGDIAVLVPGDLVPADGTILETEDFFLNESSLTGESFPAEKRAQDGAFMGTSVVTGKAVMRVEKTGAGTRFSSIAQTLAKAQGETEFDRGIRDFSILVVRVITVLVAFIFIVNAVGKLSVLESFLFALALAVGLTPELLPMIITLNLSRGSILMARKGIIVKKLSAIQDFGSMDVLCTDKTGTLTEDRISLIKCVDSEGRDSAAVFRYAYINSVMHTGLKNPLDTAIRERGTVDVRDWEKQDEIPFDFARRRDSVVVKTQARLVMVTKGAPEEIFAICTSYGDAVKPLPFGEALRAKAHAQYEALSADGFRTLGIAVRSLAERKDVYGPRDEHDMVFVGFAAFLDPPKKEVARTLERIRASGVGIKVLTGDNELVTKKICQEIGLAVEGTLGGSEVAALADADLESAVERSTVFARVLPDQKMRIIKALQKRGHVVGYLGDGINDAPSLKAADVGISVDNAVDVAKDTADFILLKKNLHDLLQGVEEGRKTLENTLKYMMMALSSNFGNMISMAGASVFLPFLPMMPPQILLNNFLYDASQFTISVDTVDPEATRKPRKWDMGFMRSYMLVFGLVSSVFDFITFAILLLVFKATGSAFQTGWFIESLATQTLVIYFIRTRGLLFEKSKPHPALVASTLGAVILGVLIAVSGIGAWFGFAPLPAGMFMFIGAIVAAYLGVVEITKRIVFRRLHMV